VSRKKRHKAPRKRKLFLQRRLNLWWLPWTFRMMIFFLSGLLFLFFMLYFRYGWHYRIMFRFVNFFLRHVSDIISLWISIFSPSLIFSSHSLHFLFFVKSEWRMWKGRWISLMLFHIFVFFFFTLNVCKMSTCLSWLARKDLFRCFLLVNSYLQASNWNN
jgi:hypothetical protein